MPASPRLQLGNKANIFSFRQTLNEGMVPEDREAGCCVPVTILQPFLMTRGYSCSNAIRELNNQFESIHINLLQNTKLSRRFKRLPQVSRVDLPTISNLPDHNMGVHLAQLTMSVLRYPMGATIGCGLRGAGAFPSKKPPKRTNVSKTITATFCNVSHGADSGPHTRILQQHHSYADEKVRKNLEAVLKNQQAKAKRENESLI